ncbi:MAG TPA: GxxExxY protein [Acetobacteraceae bacterium]|nr:GxxExxY protein [Acetobacteraceae bacterium]
MHADQLNELSRAVIGRAFVVLNSLGSGFLEKVYENALAHELRKAGISVEQQHATTVMYDGVAVGKYFVDLMIEDCLLVEIKVTKALDDIHAAQCINYLKATGLNLCLLLNFARPRLEMKRLANRL